MSFVYLKSFYSFCRKHWLKNENFIENSRCKTKKVQFKIHFRKNFQRSTIISLKINEKYTKDIRAHEDYYMHNFYDELYLVSRARVSCDCTGITDSNRATAALLIHMYIHISISDCISQVLCCAFCVSSACARALSNATRFAIRRVLSSRIYAIKA